MLCGTDFSIRAGMGEERCNMKKGHFRKWIGFYIILLFSFLIYGGLACVNLVANSLQEETGFAGVGEKSPYDNLEEVLYREGYAYHLTSEVVDAFRQCNIRNLQSVSEISRGTLSGEEYRMFQAVANGETTITFTITQEGLYDPWSGTTELWSIRLSTVKSGNDVLYSNGSVQQQPDVATDKIEGLIDRLMQVDLLAAAVAYIVYFNYMAPKRRAEALL